MKGPLKMKECSWTGLLTELDVLVQKTVPTNPTGLDNSEFRIQETRRQVQAARAAARTLTRHEPQFVASTY